MDVPNTRRIVLLGKTGVGKSSLANTIFGETKFQMNHFNDLKTHCSRAETKSVDGRNITLIDTPGFFDPGRSEEEMKPEIVRCITECAPGPHAFLIVLKVEKFTEHEQAVVAKMCEYFSEDALKYAAVVFTHGDQLPEGRKIKEYVDQSKGLNDLVEKCGGRCHVVDNKYWKSNQQDEYRSNQVQVAELLNSIEKTVKENNGGYYTDEKLQAVERAIKKEEERIKKSSGNMPEEEIREQAKSNVYKKQVNNSPRTWIRGLVGLAIIAGLCAAVSAVLMNSKCEKVDEELIAAPVAAAVKVVESVAVVKEPVVESVAVVESPSTVEEVVEVVQKTFEAVIDKLEALYERTYNPFDPSE